MRAVVGDLSGGESHCGGGFVIEDGLVEEVSGGGCMIQVRRIDHGWILWLVQRASWVVVVVSACFEDCREPQRAGSQCVYPSSTRCLSGPPRRRMGPDALMSFAIGVYLCVTGFLFRGYCIYQGLTLEIAMLSTAHIVKIGCELTVRCFDDFATCDPTT
jgi:hypothetical protein